MSDFNEDYYERGKAKGISRYAGYVYSGQWDLWADYVIKRFSPKNLIDVGCAKGFLVYALRKRGVEAYGADVSEYALANAPPGIDKFLFKVDLNHERLPFTNEFFDVVTCIETIEHIKNLRCATNEIHRVLKQNGKVLLTTPHSATITKSIDLTHVNVHHPNSWSKLFRKNQFDVSIEHVHPLSTLRMLKQFRFSDKLIGIMYWFALRGSPPSVFVLTKLQPNR